MALSEYDRELLALIDGRATYLPNVKEGQNKSQIDRKAIDAYNAAQEAIAGSVVDDGIPPADPTGASVTAGVRSLVVMWDPPPDSDHVHHTEVLIESPVGTPVYSGNVGGSSLVATGLTADQSHEVSLRHVDRWGLQSGWVIAGSATPTVTVAEKVDFAAAEISGALGWDNIDAITDPDKLGDAVITARAMAAGDAAFLNAWIETAAIESALIANLSADKIDAGEITAATITIGVGGSLQGGGGRFDDAGFRLATEFTTSTEAMRPSSSSANWYTGPYGLNRGGSAAGDLERYAGMAFFSYTDPSAPRRGTILQADGVSSAIASEDRRGQVVIRATDGQNTVPGTATESAQILLTAGESPGESGTIEIKADTYILAGHDLHVGANTFLDGPVDITGNVDIIGDLSASGQVNFHDVNKWLQGGYKELSINPGGNWARQTSTTKVKRISNFVFLSGRFTNNSGSVNNPGSVITDLGADFSPSQFKYMVVPQTTGGDYVGQCRIVIETNGQVKLAPAGGGAANDVNNGQSVSLDGVCFSVS